ncbi:MAG: dihydrodipicolinate synthase family protein [Verrucomicrobiota bacterium]
MKENFHGIIPPMITPLRGREELDNEGLECLVERMIEGGIHGIFALGTTGEAPSLSHRLRRELVQRTCEFVDGRIPVIVGITDTSIEESIRLAQDVCDLGASAVVTSAPFYFHAGQAELREYLEELLPDLPLPLLLYNMPSLTKVSFEAPLVDWALNQEKIVGLKDSSGDFIYLKRILGKVHMQREDWTILVGPEELLLETTLAGCNGGIVGGANLLPRLYVELYEAASSGNEERARALNERVMELSRLLYHVGQHGSRIIKGLKCALSLIGVCDDYVAPPFRRFRDRERALIQEHLEQLAITPLPS